MVKKLIIVEGTDNSGKDTLINNLLNYFKDENVELKHFDRPRSRNNKDAALEQNDSFTSFAHYLKDVNDDRIVICNRAWYGEYIYGVLYRERTPKDVIDMIDGIESFLIENEINTTYIQLFADPYFLTKNDDGQSLSEGKTEIIETEAQMFTDIFNRSKIENKKMIQTVIDGEFIPKKEVVRQAIELIEKNDKKIFTI